MTGAVLYTTTRSPFARKVQFVLLEKQVPHSVVLVDLAKRDAAWFRDNPIGKIPVLQLDGVHLPDSTLICETLEDRFPNPPMYEPDRLRCRVIEELADAVGEHTVAAFFAGGEADEMVGGGGIAQRPPDLGGAEEGFAGFFRVGCRSDKG